MTKRNNAARRDTTQNVCTPAPDNNWCDCTGSVHMKGSPVCAAAKMHWLILFKGTFVSLHSTRKIAEDCVINLYKLPVDLAKKLRTSLVVKIPRVGLVEIVCCECTDNKHAGEVREQRKPKVGEDVLIKIRGRNFKIGSVHTVAPHNTITIVVEDAPHVAPDAARKFYYDANAADMQFDESNRRWTVDSSVLEVLK